MLKGIDVSENNGYVDWNAVKAAGMDFAIIRLGFGNRHLDTNFYETSNCFADILRRMIPTVWAYSQ